MPGVRPAVPPSNGHSTASSQTHSSPTRQRGSHLAGKSIRSPGSPGRKLQSNKPPVPYPKPHVESMKSKAKPLHEHSGNHYSAPRSSGTVESKSAKTNSHGPSSKQSWNAEIEKQLKEQCEVAAAANRNLLEAEQQCAALQARIDELEAERPQQSQDDVISLTDDQRGSIVSAERKVKQLQDTVLSLSKRLFLATKINEDTETDGTDELGVANRKIELLLEQVDSEFHIRCEMEREVESLRAQLAEHSQHSAQPSSPVSQNGRPEGMDDPLPAAGQPMPHSSNLTVVEKELSDTQRTVASMSSQIHELGQRSRRLEVERDELKKKMEETEAMFELLTDEKDIAADECRRAQVNMRAAQMEQRELVLELEALRTNMEQEQKQAEAQRSMAEFSKAQLSRVQHDLEGASGNVRLLQSQLNQMDELQQMLEEQRTISTSCQRAVDDITARCRQLESEKEDLQAELASRHSRLNGAGKLGEDASRSRADEGVNGHDPTSSSSPRPPLSNQSDQVKFELWRLQRENVHLRQRIYQQLVGRDQQQEDGSPEPLVASAGGSVHSSPPTSAKDNSQQAATTTRSPVPPRHAPSPGVASLPRASGMRRELSDPRRRPVAPDSSSTLPASMRVRSHLSRAAVGKDSTGSSTSPSAGKDVQGSFMVDLHIGSRRDMNDDQKEDDSAKRETLEVAQLVDRLLDNLGTVRFWGAGEVEEHVKKLCSSHRRLQRKLEGCRARLKSSESDLQKNRRALVRSLSGKRLAENKPEVVVRDRSKDEKGNDGSRSDGKSTATPSKSAAISLNEYETMVVTLSEKIQSLRNVAEGEQAAKSRVEQAFLMHQRREQEIQRMLQDEINNLHRLNIKLAAEKVQAPQAAEMLQLIQRAQEDELALQQVDGLRTLVQDLQLALLQKEQKISALEWKMADAQADITVLHAERDYHVRQLRHATLSSSQNLASVSTLTRTLPRTVAAVDAATTSTLTGAAGQYKDLSLARFHALDTPSPSHGKPDCTKTLSQEEVRSKSRSSGSSLERSLSDSSLNTVVCKDGVLVTSSQRKWNANDSGDEVSVSDGLGKRSGRWLSESGIPSGERSVLRFTDTLTAASSGTALTSRPGAVLQPSKKPLTATISSQLSGSSSSSADSSAIYSRPRPRSVPVERQSQSSVEDAAAQTGTVDRYRKRQGDEIATRARAVTKGLEELMAGSEEGPAATASRTVDEAHEMACRTVEAAHGTAWQVIVHATELSEEATKFSNADLCKPLFPPSPFASKSHLPASSSRPRPGHRRNVSEGNMQKLSTFLTSHPDQSGESSKDTTWRRLKRGESPASAGVSRPGVLSPSGEASAFDKWPRVQGKLEATVAHEKLDEEGGTATWASVSTQSSTGFSAATTSSCSPSTATEDNDSATDSFSNFPKAAFRPYANGQRSVSPVAEFSSSPAFSTAAQIPKVVPVKVLGTAEKRGGRQVVQPVPSDSDHVFRPVSAMDDKFDTQSIVSTGTVVVQDGIYEPPTQAHAAAAAAATFPELPAADRQMRRRSTSDVNSISHRLYEPVPHSTTPPHTFTMAIRPAGNAEKPPSRASKTPEAAAISTIVHPTAEPPPPPTQATAAEKVATTTSTNTSSTGKGRTGSWLRRGNRKPSNEPDAPAKPAASSPGSDTAASARGRIGSSASTSLSSIASAGSKKDGFQPLKLRRENKNSARHASANLDENATPAAVAAVAVVAAAVSTTSVAAYSPAVGGLSQQLASAPYTPKAASPQQQQGPPEWTGLGLRNSNPNRLSMVEMEPLPRSLKKDLSKEKSKRSKQLLLVDTSSKGTMC